MTFNAIIEAPFGKIGIRTDAWLVREIVYLPASTAAFAPDTPLALDAAEQIRRYFETPAMRFDLPLATRGTTFQRRVWQAISSIAPGEVWTYAQLAQSVGTAPRAVGQACGSNPLPIVVPCHRVVGSNGLGGFAHHAGQNFFTDIKRWLLAHEGVTIA